MANKLEDAIGSVDCCEIVTVKSDTHIVFRVKNKPKWCAILEYVLTRAKGWSAHVCQQYFTRSGKLVYGWCFIITPEGDLGAALDNLADLLKSGSHVITRLGTAPGIGAKKEVMSVPLMGSGSHRNASLPGKFNPKNNGPVPRGAYPVGGGGGR